MQQWTSYRVLNFTCDCSHRPAPHTVNAGEAVSLYDTACAASYGSYTAIKSPKATPFISFFTISAALT